MVESVVELVARWVKSVQDRELSPGNMFHSILGHSLMTPHSVTLNSHPASLQTDKNLLNTPVKRTKIC